MANKQTFSDRLRYCMERINCTQRYVAEQVGVTQPAVAKWVGGEIKKVQSDVLFKLADLFSVDPRWLSDGQGKPWANDADGWIHEEDAQQSAATEAAPAKDQGGVEGAKPKSKEKGKRGPGRPRKENFTMELGLPGADLPAGAAAAVKPVKTTPEADAAAAEAAQAAAAAEAATPEAQAARTPLPEPSAMAEQVPAKPSKEDRCKNYASVPAYRLARGKTPLIPLMVPDKSEIDAVVPKAHLKEHDPRACRLFAVQGDTMVPAICPGDSVIVDVSNGQALVFGGVYLLYWENQSTLARIVREPDGSVIAQFDNPAYASLKYAPGEFDRLIHVVGQVLMRFGSRFMGRQGF